MRNVDFIDVDGLDCLKLIFKNKNLQMGLVAPIREEGSETLTSSQFYEDHVAINAVFSSVDEARTGLA